MNSDVPQPQGADVGTRICLVSGADQIRSRSYVNQAVYSRLYGLDYRLECSLPEGIRNKFFYKTDIMAHVLPKYDWIVWLDDDIYITDFSRDALRDLIGAAERDGQFMVIAEGPREPNGMWSTVNSGVVCLKNGPEGRELLAAMTDQSVECAREWWDPEAHGMFTAGDQDIITWWLEATGRRGGARIVGHRELNSRTHYYEDSLTDAFAVHFCGFPDKELGVAQFGRRFGVGQELVPESLLDRFSVRVRSPMGRLEYARRAIWMRESSRVKAYLRPYYRRWQAFQADRQASS